MKIFPSKLKGIVKVPPSKSISHRALIAAALSNGECRVNNLIFSNDMYATMDGLKALGYQFSLNAESVDVSYSGTTSDVINCRESGSTVRFMIPIAMTKLDHVTFNGENNLVKRPLDVYTDLFDEFKIPYQKGADYLPLTVDGRLKNGIYNIRGDISSQFITGLLMSLPMLDGDSVINITTNLESKGYVDLTLDVLKDFGIEIINNDYKSFIVRGNQKYSSRDYFVEGDYSQAAFWLVLGTLNGDIYLDGMNPNSHQGDKQIIEFINQMGGDCHFDEYLVAKKAKTHGSIIDLSQAPDLGPIITVLAALSEGKTEIINAERLRIKESDRITAITTELNKLGADITETKDGMIINGVDHFEGGVIVDSWNDHRIAMALAIASTRCLKPISLTNSKAINKSYPHFFDQFKELGGNILNDLEEARSNINEIDSQIVSLFEKRMNEVKKVISYKKANNMPILDQGREDKVIENVINKLNNKELSSYLKELYLTMMKVSKDFQNEK